MADIDHDDLMNNLETCGKALGFALATALRSREDFTTNEGVNNFADNLSDLCDSERFSPDVTIVLQGLVSGLCALTRARPTGEIL